MQRFFRFIQIFSPPAAVFRCFCKFSTELCIPRRNAQTFLKSAPKSLRFLLEFRDNRTILNPFLKSRVIVFERKYSLCQPCCLSLWPCLQVF